MCSISNRLVNAMIEIKKVILYFVNLRLMMTVIDLKTFPKGISILFWSRIEMATKHVVNYCF